MIPASIVFNREYPFPAAGMIAVLPVVLLAGGLGTRLSEETEARPKPMIEIGGMPILWHIMKIYAAHGCTEFVVATGYKGEIINDFFLHYRERASSVTIDLDDGRVTLHATNRCEKWRVHLLATGLSSMTGGRIKQASTFLRDRPFMLTYGDGLADIDIGALLRFHRAHGRKATLTAVRPPARFGNLHLDDNRIRHFDEKPQIGEGWINGGFFVLEPEIVDLIEGDATVFEREPLERLADQGELLAYRHEGFWQCMDTMRDLKLLRDLWDRSEAPWRCW